MKKHLALLFALTLPVSACRLPPPPAGSERAHAVASFAIRGMLVASTRGWNGGDLDAFLLPYADDATFVGSRGLLRGKPAIHAQYVASYFGPGRVRGTLAFRDIEVRMLGPRNALALGRYVVTERGAGQEDATGLFSLTLELRPEGWRIVHDHSS